MQTDFFMPKVMIQGVTHQIENITAPGKNPWAKITVKMTERGKNGKPETCLFPVKCFGKCYAEVEEIKKGDEVRFGCRLTSYEFERDGKTFNSIGLTAEDVFL